MTSGELIKKHGREIGATGLAVYAALKEFPDSTYKEIAELLDMGESTVKRAAAILEHLGLVVRNFRTTEKGLAQPTRVSLADPAISYRGESDKPRSSISPAISERGTQPDISERVVNTGVSLSDPDISERGTSGTPIAPYSAETIDTEKKEKPLSPPKRGGVEQTNSEGFVVQTYVGRLLEFRCFDLDVRQLATAKMEAAAAKWMHGAGYTTGQVKACYQFLKAQKWRQTDVTLVTVKGQIAAYLKGDLNDGQGKQDAKNHSPRTATMESRDYGVFAGGSRR